MNAKKVRSGDEADPYSYKTYLCIGALPRRATAAYMDGGGPAGGGCGAMAGLSPATPPALTAKCMYWSRLSITL